MKILLRKSDYHGHEVHYPNCDTSKAICELIGRPSVSKSKIECLKKLGFEIVVEEEQKKK